MPDAIDQYFSGGSKGSILGYTIRWLLAIIIFAVLISPSFILLNTNPDYVKPEVVANINADILATSSSATVLMPQNTPRSRQTLSFMEFSTGLPSSGSFNCVEIGDFNNDGNNDLVFSAEDNDALPGPTTYGLWAYTGNGGINWTNTSTGLWRGNAWAGIDLVDADGDGYMEFYATDENHGTSNSSGVKVWEYRSSSWTDSTTHVSSPLTSARPFNVQLENISGDSKLDMVISNGTGMKYFENFGGNPVTWSDKSSGLPTTGMFTTADVADMNKDGLADLVFCDYSSNEYLYIQNLTGGFHWTSYSSGFDATAIALGVELEDVNNDSHMDIVFGCRGNGLYCVLGDSGNVSGTSFSWTTANTGLPTGSHYYDIKVVDIDLDGDMDIIAPSYSNIGIQIYLGNGNTNPGTGMTWTLASNTNLTQTGRYMGVDCEDINLDGSLDIAATSWGSGVHVWLNNLTADIQQPGNIDDLMVKETTSNSILVNWTAPADNSTNASSGPVSSYDIRYSTNSIEIGNWASAIECDNEPVPAVPGTVQEYNITGLQQGTLYYVAMRSIDERPNYSPLSNVVFATTLGLADTTRPGQITDLRAIEPTNNSILLTWSAPANNGSNASSGPVAGYDLRLSTTLITNATWPLLANLPSLPVPGQPGTLETYNATGLEPETTYYFAIKAHDYADNIGWLSNIAFNTTTTTPDLIPPSPVSDLAAINATTTTINLTWTATGDDGILGTASEYDLRLATTMISDSTFSTSERLLNVSSPQPPGSTEHLQVTGLEPNTTYYFALKVSDETPLWSTISNIAVNTTLLLQETDNLPPSKITDLTAVLPTNNSLTLQWSAPGDEGDPDSGTCTEYDIRYEQAEINDQNWDLALQLPDVPPPQMAGSNESLVVTGLMPETTYYFVIRAMDEAENWSPISNLASGTTLANTGTKQNLTVILTPEKMLFGSGETIGLSIKVVTQSQALPVALATVQITSNHAGLVIDPVSGSTDNNGGLTVNLTAPMVTNNTYIEISANVVKTGFNPISTQVSITIVPPGVDYRIFNLRITEEDITLNRTKITEGEHVLISANISNIGAYPSSGFRVRFYLDGVQTGTDKTVTALAGGDYLIITETWVALAGSHRVNVTIIPDNLDLESDITDNSAGKIFDVDVLSKNKKGKDRSSDDPSMTLIALLVIIILIVMIILIFALLRKRKTKEDVQDMHDWRAHSGPDDLAMAEPVDTATDHQRAPLAPLARPVEADEPEGIDYADDGSDEPDLFDAEPPAEMEMVPEPEISSVGPEETAVPDVTGTPDVVGTPESQEMEDQDTTEPEDMPDDQDTPAEHEGVQVPCPICQNHIEVYASPCEHCGTDLEWE